MPDAFTSLLIHSDDADDSVVFADSSQNNHTITAGGDAHHESDQAKFGATSIYLDGSDYVSVPAHASFAFGSSDDFTVEMWFRPSAFGSNQYIYDFGTNDGTLSIANGSLRYYNSTLGTGSALYNTGHVLTLNAWVHLAVVRYSGITTLYVDGIAIASASDAYNYGQGGFNLGRYGGGGYYCTGYMEEIRVSKGVARWTDDFTPQAGPYGYALIADFVLEDVSPVACPVCLYERAGKALVGSTISDAADGSFSFSVPDETTEYFAVAFNDNQGILETAKIVDHLTGTAPGS